MRIVNFHVIFLNCCYCMTMGWCVIVAVGKWSVGVVAFGN